nr:DUF6484 domain-containing protein [uncultured Desulfobacter sp.]
MKEHPSFSAVSVKSTKESLEGVRVGQIVRIDGDGRILVDYPQNNMGAIPARFTRAMDIESLVSAKNEGLQVLLVFEDNRPDRPIIIDVLSSLMDGIYGSETRAVQEDLALDMGETQDITLNGKKIIFTGQEEIVLKCGKASITMTKAGKILIRGAYLLNRSSGVNKIKGGSVHIN